MQAGTQLTYAQASEPSPVHWLVLVLKFSVKNMGGDYCSGVCCQYRKPGLTAESSYLFKEELLTHYIISFITACNNLPLQTRDGRIALSRRIMLEV